MLEKIDFIKLMDVIFIGPFIIFMSLYNSNKIHQNDNYKIDIFFSNILFTIGVMTILLNGWNLISYDRFSIFFWVFICILIFYIKST